MDFDVIEFRVERCGFERERRKLVTEISSYFLIN
jgi:hypothetical protein